ncbi:MAG: hypothetical protein ACU836_13625 [Gammaproteobacteria bacterium]
MNTMITGGVSVNVPAHTPYSGPIPIDAAMLADMPTYYANNGILDNALQVILVRRDAPGVGFLAKQDPRGLFYEDDPLPMPSNPEDLQGFIREQRRFELLDYGLEHDGAASYYVFASFARWISEISPLEVIHPQHSLAAQSAELLPPLSPSIQRNIPAPPPQQGVWAHCVGQGDAMRIEGMLRTAKRKPRFLHEVPSPLFISIVAVNLEMKGGASAGSFLLDAQQDSHGNHTAVFSIALSQLAPKLNAGPTRFMVFCGDLKANPVDVHIP